MQSDNMDDLVFPPSPQWHQSHSASLCALSKDKGWMIYSLNSSIHILNPFSLKYEGILSGFHTGRINSVASATVSIPPFDAASADTPASGKSFGSLNHKIPMPEGTGKVDYSTSSPSKTVLVASGSDDQTVVCWDLASRRPLAASRVHNVRYVAIFSRMTMLDEISWIQYYDLLPICSDFQLTVVLSIRLETCYRSGVDIERENNRFRYAL
jgi:WD40 repeat protein